jgi:hypothetical protein
MLRSDIAFVLCELQLEIAYVIDNLSQRRLAQPR